MKFVFKFQPSHSYYSCMATRDLELDKICWGSKKVFCVKSKQRHRFVLLFELMDKHIQNRFRWLYNNDACYIKNRRQTESGPGSWFTKPRVKINHITFIHPVTNIKFLATATKYPSEVCVGQDLDKCVEFGPDKPKQSIISYMNHLGLGIILLNLPEPALKISPGVDLW